MIYNSVMISGCVLTRILLVVLLVFSQTLLVAHSSQHLDTDFGHCELCLGHATGGCALHPCLGSTELISTVAALPLSASSVPASDCPSFYFELRAPPATTI
ncbi:MAG: hypothetical protein PF630_02365 [Gammaproteobacteria bacterium]|nr:hypothetical protein [Gammaproteobacteria bacterium]